MAEATTHSALLLQKAINGEVVTITQSGCATVLLTPLAPVAGQRILGTAKGNFVVPFDLDHPLPAELHAFFEK